MAKEVKQALSETPSDIVKQALDKAKVSLKVAEKTGKRVKIMDPGEFPDKFFPDVAEEVGRNVSNIDLNKWNTVARMKDMRKEFAGEEVARSAKDWIVDRFGDITKVFKPGMHPELNAAVPFAAGGAVASSVDPHSDVFNDMRDNGIEGDTLPKRPKLLPPVQRMLRRSNTLGLLDTLGQITGHPAVIEPEPNKNAYGSFWPNLKNVEMPGGRLGIDTLLSTKPRGTSPSAANVLAHEYGHKRAMAATPFDGSEEKADIFARAVLHLRDQDTTGNKSKMAALELGISPLQPSIGNSSWPVEHGAIQATVDTLLGLPIYARHPLALARKKGAK
jgi:hypothetical protein